MIQSQVRYLVVIPPLRATVVYFVCLVCLVCYSVTLFCSCGCRLTGLIIMRPTYSADSPIGTRKVQFSVSLSICDFDSIALHI